MRAEVRVFWLVTVLYVPFAWCSLWGGDEMNFLYLAQRVAAGDVYFRELEGFFGPLSIWGTAAAFAALGPSLLLARGLLGLALALAGALMCRLVLRLGGGPLAGTLAGLALLLGLYPAYPGWSHHWFALALALAAVERLLAGLETSDRRAWLACGALVAATLATTQTDGLGLTAAVLAALVGGTWTRAWPLPVAWRAAGWIGLGALLAGGAVVGVLAGQGVLAEATYQMWVWPLRHYQPPGSFNDFLLAADLGPRIQPLAQPWTGRGPFFARVYEHGFLYGGALAAATGAGALLAGLAWGRLRGAAPPTRTMARWAALSIATLAFLAIGSRGRADHAHVAMYAPFAMVWLAAAAGALPGRLGLPRESRALGWLPLGLLALYVLAAGTGVAERVRRFPDAWLSLRTPDARIAEGEVFRYIARHTRPSDTIVSLPAGGVHCFFSRRRCAAPTGDYPPPSWRVESPQKVARLRRSIEVGKPALLLVLPDLGTEAEVRENLRFEWPEYRLAAIVQTPMNGTSKPTWVFARRPGL